MYHVFFTLFLLLALFGNALAAPHISVEQPTYNFGTLPQGKKLDHTFIIKNRGDEPLTISHVRPACGCTAANASSPIIPAGKTSEIKVTFDSANFFGNVSKTIAVETNDLTTPVYTLTLTGTISEELTVKPKQLNLGQLKANIVKTQTLTIDNRSTRTVKLTSLKTPMPQVTLKVDKNQIKPGESALLSVTVAPRSDDRMLSGYITITTDNPTKQEILVPVYGSLSR